MVSLDYPGGVEAGPVSKAQCVPTASITDQFLRKDLCRSWSNYGPMNRHTAADPQPTTDDR